MTFSLLPIFLGILERGLIGSFTVVAVYLTSRIMKFDDFSIEGTFGLGGAVVAFLLVSLHTNPWFALVIASLSGATAGFFTGFFHTKLGLNRLISGIVVTTMLFSISLNIGTANVALGNAKTIFTSVHQYTYGNVLLLVCLGLGMAFFFIWYMKTENGFVLRSTGINEQFVTSIGKSVPFYVILSLMIGNAMSAFAGGLFVQYSGFFSAFGNVGTLISALAGCMIAEMFAGNIFVMALLSSTLYQVVIAITVELEMDSSWQKLITGCLIVLILVIKKFEGRKKSEGIRA